MKQLSYKIRLIKIAKEVIFFILFVYAVVCVAQPSTPILIVTDIGVGYCNGDAAYQAGINDAIHRLPANTNYSGPCRTNQNFLNLRYSMGYRVGFMRSDYGKLQITRECIDTNSGKVCGYGCVKTLSGNGYCAKKSEQYCMVDNASHHACGYICMKSDYNVKCTIKPNDNCIMDNWGNIKCGKECYMTNSGEITCSIVRESTFSTIQ